MQHRLLEWLPTRKGLIDNAYFTAGAAVLSALASGVGTWLSAPTSDREMVFLFLRILLTLSICWFLIALGVAAWRRMHPVAVTAQGGSAPPATPTSESKAPVEFVLPGRWFSTPFQSTDLGFHNGTPRHTEDLYLSVLANTALDNVALEVEIIDGLGHRLVKYRHGGTFNGTVTPGMSDQFLLFRRVFEMAQVGRPNDKGGQNYFKIRCDLNMTFFPGTPAEARAYTSIFNVRINVFHRDGAPYTANFVLDLDCVEAPQSRVVLSGGNIRFDVPSHFVKPDIPRWH